MKRTFRNSIFLRNKKNRLFSKNFMPLMFFSKIHFSCYDSKISGCVFYGHFFLRVSFLEHLFLKNSKIQMKADKVSETTSGFHKKLNSNEIFGLCAILQVFKCVYCCRFIATYLNPINATSRNIENIV